MKPDYFISDIHLGEPYPKRDPREKEDALIAFVRHARARAGTLYIVGDLFDFWFEYRHSVPRTGARVLSEFYGAIQGGLRITCLPGNHDVWLGSYLSDEIGIELPDSPLLIETQGRRLFVAHGDEIRTDLKFRISRAILKNWFCIWLFGLLHPDIGVRLGRWTSAFTEARAQDRPEASRRVFAGAAEKILKGDRDAVLFGHYHRTAIEPVGNGTLVLLGDWISEDTYVVLEDSALKLMRWDGSKGVELASEPRETLRS